MKYTVLFMLVFNFLVSYSQLDYNKYFANNSMRVDLVFTGNDQQQLVCLHEIKKEPYWGGSKINLIDKMIYGKYKYEIRDAESGKIIFSKGFSTLFNEWQTTSEAKEVSRSFYQSIQFPYPLKKVKFKIYNRNWQGEFEEIFQHTINPDNYFINAETQEYGFVKIINNGDPAHKADLVFLAEGYTQNQMEKFEKDVKKFTDYLFTFEPYKSLKHSFNIWLVKSVSKEQGTDIPGEKKYKKTALNSSFYTFDMERYLTTQDIFKVRNVASVVPYDNICIIVNSEKYGGAGIYNYYSIFTSDHPLSKQVFIHELGHSFAGLGDEYYSSSTAYNNFYNLKIEPWEPNITTLVEFDTKWKELIQQNTPIPTPREEKYKNTIGAFEGGGYVSKGIYSPYMNCRMKTNEAEGFCPVCEDAIKKMIINKSK